MTLQAADTVSSIFAHVSTPAAKEADLAKMVLVLSAVVFVVVAGLVVYSVVRSGLIVKHHADAGATVPPRTPAAAPAPRAALAG
jgi:heme/copper-type cytochrome/quinol oxidase subunit 2